MSKKLFADEAREELDIGTIVSNGQRIDTIPDTLEDLESGLDMTMEAFTRSVSDLKFVEGAMTSLGSKKLASVEYFASLESYTPVMEHIASNLGVKSRVPSMEDFKNSYGTQASHEIAMEGFADYIKKIWEKLKEFVRAFFKKIMLFFKRLFNSDLDLDEYEQYIDGMVSKIKEKKLRISDPNKTVKSNLPKLLANDGMESVDPAFIATTGVIKIDKLIKTVNEGFITKMGDSAKHKFPKILSELKDIMKRLQSKEELSDEQLSDMRAVFMSSVVSALDPIFQHRVMSPTSIPESVHAKLFAHKNYTSSTSLKNSMTSSIVDADSTSGGLPKNFNCFMFTSTDGNIFLSASVTNNTEVSDNLRVIPDVDKLVEFQKLSKRLKTSMQHDRVDDVFKRIDEQLNDLIDFSHDKLYRFLESAENDSRKNKSNNHKGPFYPEQSVDEMAAIFFDHVDSISSNDKKLGRLSSAMANAIPKWANNASNLTAQAVRQSHFTSLMNAEFILFNKTNELVDILNNVIATYDAKSNGKYLIKVINWLKNLQSTLIDFITNMQIMMREILVNLNGTFMEIRYQLVKYIYDSAKQFE